MKKKRVIVWFRQDLRVHDNEALIDALRHGEEVIPVYVFDERVFKGTTKYGFPKTGKYRAKFILESVQNLKTSLKALGSNLYIRTGITEDVLFELAQEVKSAWVFCNRERTEEEVKVQDALEKKLWEIGQELRYSRGKMLYYTADLPFPVNHTPDIFTHFKKEVERFIEVRKPLPTPEKDDFAPLTIRVQEEPIPELTHFGHDDSPIDKRSVIPFIGGESVALKRLQYYIWESDLIKKHKNAKNGLTEGDASSKFSPWISQGCLSPKLIYWELKRYETERVKNKSTYALFFELLWRDYFRLMGKKHGNCIFKKEGIQKKIEIVGSDNHQLFQMWAQGKTGVPFIDANMRELAQTGFISNRGRQNVASFLIKDLQINWQMGADYFESLLIDYDPCSNWGNWNYIAGVGSDVRENRYFNILKEAKRFDVKGDYIRKWCPELNILPSEKIHRPDVLSESEQIDYGFKLGVDYPKPLINTEKWI
jgi:deoxyribodipyrimidine photo-lyase